MKTKLSRVFVILMAVAMVLMMTGCSEATSNFLKNGWDYEVDGVKYEPGFNDTYESVAPAANGSAADRSAYGSYSGPAASGSTATAGAATAGAAKAGAAKAGGSAAPAANKTSYTAAEALELYKSAANKVKTTAKSATRTSETIRTISGSIPSLY